MSTLTFTETRGDSTWEITQKVKDIDIRDVVAPLIAERRKWTKYGMEKGVGPGAQKSTTDVEEKEVVLRLFPKSTKPAQGDQQQEPAKKQAVMSGIKCRACGGGHLTHTCPYKGKLPTPAAEAEATPEPTNGRYVPPGRGQTPAQRAADDEAKTLKVSNLPSDVDEHQLKTAFGKVGRLVRCHVAREKDTRMCRGFAFVSYATKEDAERAKDALDGKSINHLVIQVEFSKKRPQ